MNKMVSRTIIFLGVLALVIGNLIAFGPRVSYAEDLEIVGNDIGLEVIPDSRRLFDLTNLNPGDIKEANLKIRNNYIATFELFMRAEKMGSSPQDGGVDLFGHLDLTVYLRDKVIYSGSMKDFATSNISLGKFEPKDMENLRAVIHLPGPETGNEYQGASLDTKWIFTAQLEEAFLGEDDEEDIKPEDKKEDKKPVLPKTGEVMPMALYGVGALLLALGIGIGRRKK